MERHRFSFERTVKDFEELVDVAGLEVFHRWRLPGRAVGSPTRAPSKQ
jgi:hypothetical protein